MLIQQLKEKEIEDRPNKIVLLQLSWNILTVISRSTKSSIDMKAETHQKKRAQVQSYIPI